LQAEFGDAYNQPKKGRGGDDDGDGDRDNTDTDTDSGSVYEDDAQYELPFRFLDQWTGNLDIDRDDMNFEPGTVFTGTLLVPPLAKQDETTTSSGLLQNIEIQLQPSCFCIDRSPTFRGYWLVTDYAYYWLHQPAVAETAADDDDDIKNIQLLQARAVLTCLSNILHYMFCDNNENNDNDKASQQYAKQSIAQVASMVPQFNLPLAQLVGGSVAQHLIQAHPALTPRCALVKSLQKCNRVGSAAAAAPIKNKKKLRQLLALCERVEARLPQTPWGQPCPLATEILQQIQNEQGQHDKDSKENDDDAMSIDEVEAVASDGKKMKVKTAVTSMATTTTSKRSRSRSVAAAAARAKRPKKPPPRNRYKDGSSSDEDSDTNNNNNNNEEFMHGDDDEDDYVIPPPPPPRHAGSSRARRACRQNVNYALDKDDDDDSEEFNDDDDEDSVEKKKAPPSARGRRPAARPKKNAKAAASREATKRSKKVDSSDEEEEEEVSSESDEDLSGVEPEPASDDDDESVSSNDEQDKKPKVSKRRVAAKGKGRKAVGKSKAAARPSLKSGKEKIKMADAFEPINAPANKTMSLATIHEEKEFLDSCGVEATDDVIDRLVGDQVDKILPLLERSLTGNAEDGGGGGGIGSAQCLLQLGTACSGTDAPALALTIVQEQLEQRGKKDLFQFSHTMSCEVEPFKQSYLARNFDSTLYPDIAKLCDDLPRDVYGQEKPIPPFNMFVAGTSCRNFSMQNPTRRMDLEDKGCSGETFFAAVEALYKFKPPFAIFENVIAAPWAKMSEYITGRVKLSDCDSNKAIKDIKDKNAHLAFVLDKDKNIVAERVPSVYGIRVGAVVSGFLRPDSLELNEIKWPAKSQKAKECTLNELMKANGIDKKHDTLVFKTPCMYKTHTQKVDTKLFGLPQTRLRTYMFVWRPDEDDLECDLGDYWMAIVKHLQAPVRHSLKSFILQVDHDIIRVFREALRGPPGRQTMRGVNLEPYFWSGTNSNLRHNKVAREKLGLEDEARFTTNWHANGKRQVPPHYWLEVMKCNSAREMDLIDILAASAMRDAEAHDSSYSSYYWNISQNASKEKHRIATCGIAGCITPGGDFLLPQEGRPILGCEKLMIQGIPYFRLMLGNETEVQLGDLAGTSSEHLGMLTNS
jgi:site-specific DNA-cytosine methylase